ncbi:uncharacterized protein K452DRAFT_325221 [Aplosporella prunicola CBS 121167]|uniref:PRISE-like Rossmann-fold domain-containing protein n=1 Tax=Aplosporella prunicola CBS 121167 TaxID=1176127 RepID=A0A6A6BPI3_9PEZI|nr:uncharacterized protein K452DRAFT_325221 [Aplosporella prunicola CBS 121167]KAF2144737.1 hypothetical protein K452DRAFT_325221 [Aplosporella prunicola CBS 121167]
MPSAIITGATGILGREIVTELGQNPQQWPTVHALSRSKKDTYPENVIHNHIDLTGNAEEMAKDLKNVEGEYIFFSAYLQKTTEEDNTKVNGDMLENFLKALEINGSISKVKRIILVTGCKQYGVHLGATKNPMVETDPWLPEPRYPPNFYYRQQMILQTYSQNHNLEWVVTYPNDVIGFAKGNFMNLATSVGLYAAVSKELGHSLAFPGSARFYTGFDCFTHSRLHAQFCAWAALEPRAANQAFNVVNGDTESWQNLWPKLARRYGLTVAPDQFSRKSPDASSMPLAEKPPVSVRESELGIQSTQSAVEAAIDLETWSQKAEVKEAWDRLAAREGLEKDAFEKATWAFLKFVLGRNYDLVISMNKARSCGWTGYIDTWESLEKTFDELEEAKILPKHK